MPKKIRLRRMWHRRRNDGVTTPERDIDWWTSRDFSSLEDTWKQAAIREVHKTVCACGIVWHRFDGYGPPSIYFDGRDHYYGMMLNHVKEALPFTWQIQLTEIRRREATEWDMETQRRNNPKYVPR